jgi:hypothetical protein
MPLTCKFKAPFLGSCGDSKHPDARIFTESMCHVHTVFYFADLQALQVPQRKALSTWCQEQNDMPAIPYLWHGAYLQRPVPSRESMIDCICFGVSKRDCDASHQGIQHVLQKSRNSLRNPIENTFTREEM